MSDIFSKISTLINAQLNDIRGINPRSPLAGIKLNAEEAEKNPQRSAHSLRRRLDEASEYEKELQHRIDERRSEAAELDKLVDELLRSGDAPSAQRLQSQLNLKQQHLTIAESELRQHRLMTRHLWQELNALEAALDREQNRPAAPSAAAGGKTQIPIEGVGSSKMQRGRGKKSILDAMSSKFDETRANLENLLDDSPAPERQAPPRPVQRFEIVDEAPDPRQPKPRKQDEPDMKARLSRLSKPAEDD